MSTEILDKSYAQYNDYVFKSILLKRANGILDFVNIPYKITKTLISEYTALEPNICRMDFVGESEKNGRDICLIVECQTNLPTDDDVKRFFQYVSSLRIFKDAHVELYILCTQESSYSKKDFTIKEDCVYTMHMISLKNFKAEDIFNNIENKLRSNDEIDDADIASLQLIVYTDYCESKLEILNKARALLERISQMAAFDINEKMAIVYLFDMLSANMLDDTEHDQYMERNKMLINPRERYFKNKGIEEGIEEGMKEGIVEGKLEAAKNLLKKGFSIEEIAEITNLPEEDILNAK